MTERDGRDSPCVAVCTTALGDPVCRGCGRTFDEVAHWTLLDAEAKRDVWSRLEARRRLLEIGLVNGWLVAIERDASGEEWAWVPETPACPRFRLVRDEEGAGLRLVWRDLWGGETHSTALPAGAAPSARAYAALLDRIVDA